MVDRIRTVGDSSEKTLEIAKNMVSDSEDLVENTEKLKKNMERFKL
jgi:arginine/ornithine N-succinyltransferase beta subunit